MNKNIYVFTGSKKDFEEFIYERIAPDEDVTYFMELIKDYNGITDPSFVIPSNSKYPFANLILSSIFIISTLKSRSESSLRAPSLNIFKYISAQSA